MKKIEVCHLKPSELKRDFGNPRKITKENIKKLKDSLEKLGDHDCIKIDESNNVISGNQRLEAMISIGIDTPILCKKLIGYSEAEKKAINIQSNTHFGEFDDIQLDNWIEDIKIEFDDVTLFGLDNTIDVPYIEYGEYETTNQKSKYLQDNMFIKIGDVEFFIKKENQPREFDRYYEKKEYNKDVVIKHLIELASEL